MQISDLSSDLATGVVPMMLLRRLTGAEHIKFTPEPKNRIKMIENLQLFLKAVSGLGVSLTNISAEDLADGRRTLILGLTWRLITHFVAQAAPGSDGAEELLAWLRSNAASLPDVAIAGFGGGLGDGRVFCAVLAQYDPSSIDLDALPADAQSTLQLAFDAGERTFGAPQLLDAADVVGSTEEGGSLDARSMQAYVLKLRQALRRHAEHRRARVLEARASFVAEARRLTMWATAAAERLASQKAAAEKLDLSVKSDVADAEAQLTSLEEDFRGGEKVRAAAERSDLLDISLARVRQLIRSSAETDARIVDATPEESVVVTGPAAAQALQAEAEAELTAAVDALDAAWQAAEEADTAYGMSLWDLLVEKATDLIAAAASKEARALKGLATQWSARLSVPLALHFRSGAQDPWQEASDSVAATREGLHALDSWLTAPAADVLPGVRVLAARKAACLAKRDDAARRREKEGREPPESVAALLQSEWSEMEAKAAELRLKVGGLVAWQAAQARTAAATLADTQRELLTHIPSATKELLTAIESNSAVQEQGSACLLM